MKCPKYIKQALLSRANHAERFLVLDAMLTEWLEKNSIQVDGCDIDGGVEAYANPHDSSSRILEAIEAKEEK